MINIDYMITAKEKIYCTTYTLNSKKLQRKIRDFRAAKEHFSLGEKSRINITLQKHRP